MNMYVIEIAIFCPKIFTPDKIIPRAFVFKKKPCFLFFWGGGVKQHTRTKVVGTLLTLGEAGGIYPFKFHMQILICNI